MNQPTEQDSTPARLLMAAAEVFAEQGFDGTSTRDICSRAKANVAAISYHFGGKEQIFDAVLALPLRSLDDSIGTFADAALPLSEALRRMYLGMLAPLRRGSIESAAMRAVARCMAAPGAGGPRPHDAVIVRHHAALATLVGRHLPAATPAVINLVCGALVGMAMHALVGQFRDGPAPVMWTVNSAADLDALADRLARYGEAIIAAEARP